MKQITVNITPNTTGITSYDLVITPSSATIINDTITPTGISVQVLYDETEGFILNFTGHFGTCQVSGEYCQEPI